MSRVWVTGADGGIGSACVGLLKGGHDVYPMGSRYDVCSQYELHQFFLDMPRQISVDTLVYAAGVNHLDWSTDISSVEMNHVYDVNVTGLVRCLQVAPTLEKVVVIGSDAAHRPMRTSIAYNASKAALEAAVKVIARERAHEGFVINVVSPGLVAKTGMTEYVMDRTRKLRPELDLHKYMVDGIPAGHAAFPSDVADVVDWLVTSAPSYVNGSVIEVNGAR